MTGDRRQHFGFMAISAIGVLITGCAETPYAAVPGVGHMVSMFQQIKTVCECHRDAVKSRVRPVKNKEGKALYDAAKGANDAAISRIVIALGEQPGTLTKEELDGLFATADQERRKFLDFFQKPDTNVKVGECTSMEFAASLLDFGTSIVELVNSRNREALEERRTVRAELEKCRWKEW
jgi:hypothetical protein